MVVRGLNLTGFRNYKTLSAKFSPSCNWIIGSNGQGKTNLVEAIHYLCNLESFRTRKTTILLNTGSCATRLVGEVERNSVLHKIDITVMTMLAAGPAKATQNMSRLGLRKLAKSTGTGLA